MRSTIEKHHATDGMQYKSELFGEMEINRTNIKWILASASPRRRELLTQIGLDFEVKVSDADENIEEELPPDKLVMRLSEMKAQAVADELESLEDYCGIIAADTIVYHNGKVLGKPQNEEDAFQMLKSLSGDSHSVYTGVTMLMPGESITFNSETKVFFDTLDDEEIRNYIKTGEPMDKAGAYGIQGFAGAFVTRIEGEYANVVGFPIGEFAHRLREMERKNRKSGL